MAISNFLFIHRYSIIACICSFGLYRFLAVDFERNQISLLISSYVLLCALAFFIYQYSSFTFNQLLAIGLLFRLLFIMSVPFLSQDFYRFIWDGNLLIQGINPYSFTPNGLLQDGHFSMPNMDILHQGMGDLSARHFSNYPPLNQMLFAISAWVGQGNIFASTVVMRLIIIGSEIGIALIGGSLLVDIGLSKKQIMLWTLNPFIIIEVTANLHFDGLMTFWVLLGLYFLNKKQWFWSALAITASIHLKLIPLMLIPIIWSYLGFKQGLKFSSIVGALTIIGFLPFVKNNVISNYTNTIGLWFNNFEFNASIFNLAQEMGRAIAGKNLISTISSFFSGVVLLFVLSISIIKRPQTLKDLVQLMLWTCCLYLWTTTTVHPWYLALPLLLSIFTTYRFMLLWSTFVILSYAAYAQPIVHENLWILALEYLPVFSLLAWELKRTKITSS